MLRSTSPVDFSTGWSVPRKNVAVWPMMEMSGGSTRSMTKRTVVTMLSMNARPSPTTIGSSAAIVSRTTGKPDLMAATTPPTAVPARSSDRRTMPPQVSQPAA
jgi:hypothetical protein